MKRIVSGCIILLLIVASSVIVTAKADRLTDDAIKTISQSAELYASGNTPDALLYAENAFAHWKEHTTFADIFIRHSEADAAGDAFNALIGALSGDDEGAVITSYSQLLSHLDCIRRMEHPNIGSIF